MGTVKLENLYYLWFQGTVYCLHLSFPLLCCFSVVYLFSQLASFRCLCCNVSFSSSLWLGSDQFSWVEDQREEVQEETAVSAWVTPCYFWNLLPLSFPFRCLETVVFCWLSFLSAVLFGMPPRSGKLGIVGFHGAAWQRQHLYRLWYFWGFICGAR